MSAGRGVGLGVCFRSSRSPSLTSFSCSDATPRSRTSWSRPVSRSWVMCVSDVFGFRDACWRCLMLGASPPSDTIIFYGPALHSDLGWTAPGFGASRPIFAASICERANGIPPRRLDIDHAAAGSVRLSQWLFTARICKGSLKKADRLANRYRFFAQRSILSPVKVHLNERRRITLIAL